jgi:hypothetical protein
VARKTLKLAFTTKSGLEFRHADLTQEWARTIIDKHDSSQDRLFVVLFKRRTAPMPDEQDEICGYRVLEARCDRGARSKQCGYVVMRKIDGS